MDEEFVNGSTSELWRCDGVGDRIFHQNPYISLCQHSQRKEINTIFNSEENSIIDIHNMEVDSVVSLESPMDVVDNIDKIGEAIEQLDDKALENNIEQIVAAPYIGMEFTTEDDAYNFYNGYAFMMGFGVRKNSTNKSSVGDRIGRTYVCSKEGRTKNANPQRDITRTGCLAKMKIIRNGAKGWKVNQFVKQHNGHELTSPSKVKNHRSHKRLYRSSPVKSLMNELDDEGLKLSVIAKTVNRMCGSEYNSHVTTQEIHDYLRVARKNNIGRECIEVIKHFQKQRSVDPEFYFAMELDHNHTFRSIFWADGRSRASYLEFGDVLVFDVTYKTNKFSLPFALFTGVNHHRQTTLFGCALLADEKEETFVWLFQEWLNCMSGKAPKVIITDQDVAIGNAIERVFPETRHRYCKWHLSKHILDHMVRLKSMYSEGIEDEFRSMQDSACVDEAENIWNEMDRKYKFEDGSWITDMWKNRHRWVPCFLKDVFLAGMTTSQRNESINSFFDRYVNSMTPLNKFVMQYDKALTDRRYAEERADFKTLNSNPRLFWKDNEIEKQAGNCYTRVIFEMFQQELKEGILLFNEEVSKERNISKYLVGPMSFDKKSTKVVTYEVSNDVIISYECAKFEMDGMLCKHALNILHKERVVQIPKHYILKRWTMKARYLMSTACIDDVPQGMTQVTQLMQWAVHTKYNKVFQAGCNSLSILKGLDSYLSNVLAEIEDKEKAKSLNEPINQAGSLASISSIGIASLMPEITIRDPSPEITIRDPSGRVTTKGRPKTATRMKSGLELSQEKKQKKQKTCGFCGEKGHYKTGCHKAKVNATSNSSALNNVNSSSKTSEGIDYDRV